MKRPDKAIIFHDHAMERLHQRRISKAQVENAVWFPDAVRAARRPGSKRFEKEISARKRLAVIAGESSDTILIVSAFWI